MKDALASEISAVYPEYAMYRQLISRKHKIHKALAHEKLWRKFVNIQSVTDHLLEIEKLLARLDKNSPIKQIRKTFTGWAPTKDYLVDTFGIDLAAKTEWPEPEKFLLEFMKDKANKGRREERKQIIALEIIEKNYQGWYGVFNSLTVAEHCVNDVFGRNAKAWPEYLRKVDNGLRKAAGLKHREFKRKDWHTFCAVIERGTTGTKRLHIHVLHMFRVLPKGARDPNHGRSLPKYRELSCMKVYWQYGWSTPEMLRINSSDAYARAGYVWPVEKPKGASTYRRMRASSPEKAAGYMAKYVVKPGKEKLLWRTRATRNYGRVIIQEITERSNNRILEVLAVSKNASLMFSKSGIKIPMRLLRIESLKEWVKRQKKMIDGKPRKEREVSTYRMLRNLSVTEQRKNLIELSREHRRRTHQKTPQVWKSAMNTETATLSEMDFCDLKNRWEGICLRYGSRAKFGVGASHRSWI